MSLYKIEFTQIAIKTVSKYKKSNPVQYKKLAKLLNELMEHPRTGTGHPEPLKTGDSITYSRRISKWKIHSYLPPSVHFKVIP